MRPGHKTIAMGVAAGSAAVLVLAALAAWPDLAREYHLRRLRRDPGALEEMLADLPGARRDAVWSFVGKGTGREALIRLFLKEIDLERSRFLVRTSRPDFEGAYVLTLKKWIFLSASNRISINSQRECSPHLARIIEFLPACRGDPFRLPGFEELEFQVLGVQDKETPVPARRWWTPALLERLADPSTCVVFFRSLREHEPFEDFPPQTIEGNPFSLREGAPEIRHRVR